MALNCHNLVNVIFYKILKKFTSIFKIIGLINLNDQSGNVVISFFSKQLQLGFWWFKKILFMFTFEMVFLFSEFKFHVISADHHSFHVLYIDMLSWIL
jgi:hypothetical protein